jgi:hypothetical protein
MAENGNERAGYRAGKMPDAVAHFQLVGRSVRAEIEERRAEYRQSLVWLVAGLDRLPPDSLISFVVGKSAKGLELTGVKWLADRHTPQSLAQDPETEATVYSFDRGEMQFRLDGLTPTMPRPHLHIEAPITVVREKIPAGNSVEVDIPLDSPNIDIRTEQPLRS